MLNYLYYYLHKENSKKIKIIEPAMRKVRDYQTKGL